MGEEGAANVDVGYHTSPFRVSPRRNLMTATARLDSQHTTLLLIDFQERLYSVMPPDVGHHHRERAHLLLQGARLLGLPILATEQYPQGLGPTLPDLKQWVDPANIVEKREFSCCDSKAFQPHLEGLTGRQVVVLGMEAHICVWQTVRDLRERGLSVHVCVDAILSRHKADYRAAVERFAQVGAVPVTAEAVLFDAVRVAQGDAFKGISRLVR